MRKSATVRARVEPELKEKAEKVLNRAGLSATQAITLFYRQVVLHRGLPFLVRLPNETTRRTLERTEKGADIRRYLDIETMFEDLGL